MKMEKKAGRQTVRALLQFYRRAWKWNPLYIVTLFGRVVSDALRPFPGILFPALIMDALLEGEEIQRTAMLILAMAGSTFLVSAMDIWLGKALSVLQSGFKDFLNGEISGKQLRLPLEKIESTEVRELFLKANGAVSGDLNFAVRRLGGARGADAIGTESVKLVSSVLRGTVLILALLKLGIVPLLVILAVLVFHMVGGNKERRASYQERTKTAPYRNKNNYVTNVMTDFQKAKEIRLYGLQDFLLERFQRNKGYFYKAREEAKPAYLFSHSMGILGEAAKTAVTYGHLVAGVLRGSMTLGAFTGYSAALNNLSSTLISAGQAYLNIHLYGECFVDFEEAMAMEEREQGALGPERKVAELKQETAKLEQEVAEPEQRATEPKQRIAGLGREAAESKQRAEKSGQSTAENKGEAVGIIAFRGVSFSYPGSGRKALDDVSLEIPLKGSISIVGQNGSGKSTLAKLLLRLYRPDEGQILLDGTDIWEIPLEEYRRQVAAVFQDYSIFALDVRRNVSPEGDGDEAVWESLRKAGAEQSIQKLPRQLDTELFGHYHEGGVDLSGGEKQKLAIARMLHRGSGIMVLDEPTAALDPKAELEIYEQVHSLAEGRLVLYISHRMSSCHFSDAVLVLEEGKVAEYGSHRELMEKGGLYYRLYNSQAEMYRKGGEAA